MKYKDLREIEIDKLEFDNSNPRLPKKLHGAHESAVIEWMLLDASLLDLIASIAYNGFFPGEPLLVIENKTNGLYTVIEGNRRLASCKIINNPNIVSVKSKSINNILESSNPDNYPKSVPAFVFEERKDILAYLGYRHVTGVKSWGALPKAKYLFELFKLENTDSPIKERCRVLAKKIGSRSDYVLRLLTSYQLFNIMEEEHFFGIKNLSEESIEFSNLVDAATSFANISYFLGIDFDSENPLHKLQIDNLKELSYWLFNRDENNKTKLGENRNIRLLNQIVNNEKALSAFRNDVSIKEAFLLTSVPDEIFSRSIHSSLKSLENANDVKEILNEDINSEIRESLKRITRLSNEICEFIS